MLRKLIIFGICAGISASVPVLYQSNPELFHGLLRGVAGGQEEAAEAPQLSMLRASAEGPRVETLSGRKVRLSADGRGHFNADFKLNGRAVDGMIDTGATLVAINESTARRIGLKLTSANFTHQVETANGKARAAAAIIERIAIGRIEARNVQAVVLEDKALSGTLVGMSFLKQLRRFEVEDGALILEQ